MVRIVQKVGKDIFYNYLQQLGFGKQTGIQLANEARGKISALEKFSLARFFNNSFGQ
jgi:cell division protein FtsI/penicillin-binding protein 2